MPKELFEAYYSVATVEEQKEGKPLRFKGVFQRADTINENKRIYPREVLEKAIQKYKEEKIEKGRAVGTLEHPEDGKTKVDAISHKIVDLWMEEDGTVYGVAEVLDTPAGKILEGLIKGGVKIGISSRGFGSSKVEEVNGQKVEVIQDDFVIEAFDVVYEPSTPGAFNESKNGNDTDYEVVKKEDVVKLLDSAITEAVNVAKEKTEALVEEVVKECARFIEENTDVKKSLAFSAITKIVAPFIDPSIAERLESIEELNNQKTALLKKVEELELENYKLQKALVSSSPEELYNKLKEAKSREEADRIVKEFKESRRSKDIKVKTNGKHMESRDIHKTFNILLGR